MASRRGRILIGCSGWQYASWRGRFYPERLASARWLPYYATHFRTVEANGTFYRLPEKRTFVRLREATPPGFVLTVKASRYLTHLKRLKQPTPPLQRLFRRLAGLGPRLGPVLFQLPRTMKYDASRLRVFLRALNRQRPRTRYVLEFRDPGWYRDDVYSALRKARVALCLHDMPGSAIAEGPREPFVYIRFHGTTKKYGGCYPDAALRLWARRIRAAADAGHDVYAYFNNDIDGAAVANARTLIKYVGPPGST
jgi:uncharacterized protein YecE (DUF72 family)